MDSGNVDRGAALAGVGGIVLLCSLFMPWFGVDGPGFSRTGTAWTELAAIDLVLLAVGLLAVAWSAALATEALAPSAAAAAAVTAAGLLAAGLTIYRIVDLPTPEVPPRLEGVLDFGVRFGAFVGLAGALAVVAGALLWLLGVGRASAR